MVMTHITDVLVEYAVDITTAHTPGLILGLTELGLMELGEAGITLIIVNTVVTELILVQIHLLLLVQQVDVIMYIQQLLQIVWLNMI